MPFVVSSFVRSISNVAVIGSGQMGSSIAAIAAVSGYKVKLFDCDGNHLERSVERTQRAIRRLQRHKPANFLDSVTYKVEFTLGLSDVISDSDLVIESITEDLIAKHRLFRSLEGLTPPSCLFATNTSSLSINEIAEAFSRKASFCGLHFFNPAEVMKLVEITECEFTSDETLKALTAFAESLGKIVIKCKDTPGFIVNRLLIPYLLEAVEMWERGDACVEDIDTAMRAGAGHPMGPFELADHIGLDTLDAVLKYWIVRYPDERVFRLNKTLQQLLVYGRLGKKVGHGFFLYDCNGRIIKE